MKIKIINPAVGLSQELVEGMKEYLQRDLDEGTEIEFASIKKGFTSVETEAQAIVNGAEVLKLVADAQDWDGIFINCFDDPGLLGAREISRVPVMGPYGASLRIASLLSEKVGVITTDPYGILCEERKALHNGLSNVVAAIEYVDFTVLELHNEDLKKRILQCCEKLELQGIGTAVLGCTGMNFVADDLKQMLKERGCKVQLIEPMKTGVKTLELIIKMGYTNSINSTAIHIEDLKS